MGSGFDEQQFDVLCHALQAFAQEWSGSSMIPKLATSVLIDLSTLIAAHASYYTGEELRMVVESASVIDKLVQSCVAIEEE